MSPRTWRIAHTSLASVVVFGGAVHAMLIEGTMEPISKSVLCAFAAIATAIAVVAPWLRARRRLKQKVNRSRDGVVGPSD
jgi:Kef-type K+ transport system membrane component KefB